MNKTRKGMSAWQLVMMALGTVIGGFAILITYAVIIATHIRFRKKYGCPPEGKCQMPGYPYASWIVLSVIFIAIVSMPFIPGQEPGMIAGILMVVSFTCIYVGLKFSKRSVKDMSGYPGLINKGYQIGSSTEFSKELTQKVDQMDKDKPKD